MFRIKSPLEGTGGRGQLSKFMTKIFLLGGVRAFEDVRFKETVTETD